MTKIEKILFLAIFFLASFFRLYGVNWDQNQHLHPDERFLTMVTGALVWPKDFHEYLDTDVSPMNPHNKGFGFFVYGTFPVFFTKWVAENFASSDYNGIALIGRQVSALFDIGTVILVYLIAKQVISNSKFLISNQIPNSKSKLGQLEIRSIRNFPLIPMFLYSVMVLPIQLSHFYAVETYLTFFLTSSFYILIKIISVNDFYSTQLKTQNSKLKTTTKSLKLSNLPIINLTYPTLLGISFGLAIASKISAVYFLPIIALGFLFILIKMRKFLLFSVYCLLFLISCYFTVRLAQPYLFADRNLLTYHLNPKVLDNWKQLSSFMKPDSGFPPSVQWFNIKPILFPFASIILWGMGLPLGVTSLFAIFYILFFTIQLLINLIKKKSLPENNQFIMLLCLIWTVIFFIYQGIQPAPTIRYFHVIYPFVALLTGWFIHLIIKRSVHNKQKALPIYIICFIFLVLLWPISFSAVYTRPHSRVAASDWIYANIPAGSKIATETWDDGLPMTLDAKRINQLYQFNSLALYDPDKSSEKWPKITKTLADTDYIALTSNRLWGSITKAGIMFPLGSKYYRLLFDGSLGFEKIAEMTSYPTLPLPFLNKCIYIFPPQETLLNLRTEKGGIIRIDKCDLYESVKYQGIVFRNDLSEETFTVYDHPKVLIFKNTGKYSEQKLLEIITSPN